MHVSHKCPLAPNKLCICRRCLPPANRGTLSWRPHLACLPFGTPQNTTGWMRAANVLNAGPGGPTAAELQGRLLVPFIEWL